MAPGGPRFMVAGGVGRPGWSVTQGLVHQWWIIIQTYRTIWIRTDET